MVEGVSDAIHGLHKSVQECVTKLVKNKDCRERVMQWLRQAVALNMDKQKMFTQVPVCSDGFVLNLIDLLLIFCGPFTLKFAEYH